MKSCQVYGPYCSFHDKMLAIFDKLETQEWFSVYQEAHKKEEWVWNDDIFDYELVLTFKDHLDFDFLTDIIYEEVLKIERSAKASESHVDLLLKSLESFDYESYFYASDYESYSYDSNYHDGVLRFKRNTGKLDSGYATKTKREANAAEGEAGSGETMAEEQGEEVTPEGGSHLGEPGFIEVGGGNDNESEEQEITEEEGEETTTSIIARGRKFVSLTLKLLQTIDVQSLKRKRRKRGVIIGGTDVDCSIVKDIPHLIGEMRDGAVFSVAKMKKIQLLKDDDFDRIDRIRVAGLENCKKDIFLDIAIPVLKPLIETFDEFLKSKEFSDGFQYDNDTHCELSYENKFECTCECSKKKKLSIYNIFASLSLLDNKEFKFGGDVLSWYYNNVMEGKPSAADTRFSVEKNISEEVINLDRKLLSDISKKEVQLGLRDFLSNMAQPITACKAAFDFPKLNSWNPEAKKEIFNLFNYDETSPFFGVIKLRMPDFENMTAGSMCTDPEGNNLTNYCKMVDNLPDLRTTMSLLQLAKYPSKYKDDVKEYITSFTKSKNPIPNLSYIPTCFFGESAAKFWKLREYSEREHDSNISQSEFQSTLNIPEPDLYRYPKCTHFVQRPTDSGICHTFNGLDLRKILKPSSWVSSFQESFGDNEVESNTRDVLKSEGIDKEGGFVFSLDTMQSYFITKRKRDTPPLPYFNSFWMKVHKPGDLPIMSEEKSSWTKISSPQNDMVTKFISLKGEKVSHKSAFNDIKEETRKCKFSDDGPLKLFDYYT